MNNKKWENREFSELDIEKIIESYNLPRSIAKTMAVRGLIDNEVIKSFFYLEINSIHDPFLMHDMHQAVNRIVNQINENKPILIYGDYDVDGTTATSILYLFFKSINVDVDHYIPSRENEGYGLSNKGIDYANYIGSNLVITCDCGITAVNEVKYASSLNIDVIITDHHKQADILPSAEAILNPNKHICSYPFKGLCGAGVVFKLIMAIAKEIKYDKDIWEFCDLAAIGTAADMVPLLDENRLIVSKGLEKINNRPRVGVNALINTSGLNKNKITVGRLSFWFAPKINAAGRLGDAGRAVKLLISSNINYALKVANELENENLKRRDITEHMIIEAEDKIKNDINQQKSHSIILFDEHWHEGVIGIVASKIKEKYNKPTIIISINDSGIGKASCRSISTFDLVDAISNCSELLIGYGGHPMAAGFSILKKNIDQFIEQFSDYTKVHIKKENLIPKIFIDSKMNLSDITIRFLKFLDSLEPFGPKNPRPIFRSNNLQVVGNPKVIGKNRDTIKFLVKEDRATFEAIGFGLIEKFEYLVQNKPIDIVYMIGENEWRGEKTIQLEIKDIRLAVLNNV